MSKDYFSAVKDRRSYYGISKESKISAERLGEIIAFGVKHSPSAFNSQSARVVLLLNTHHDRLWNITKESLRAIVPADGFAATEEKIDSFRNGHGTVLYFEDQRVVKGLQDQFPLYTESFPQWSLQSSGMLQHVIWTALEIEGFGVSLQHYNQLIEADVKSEWKIPDSWRLISQMPFGVPTAEPNEKELKPLEERVKIFD